jgi:hypothetical protein
VRTTFRIAWVTLSMLAVGAGCGFASWQRAAKQCFAETAPLTTRPTVDEGAYVAANATLLATLPRPDGATQTAFTAHPYRRCSETPDSDVVGVTSTARYDVETRVTKCDIAAYIEGRLGDDGWSVYPLETSDPRGGGNIRVTKFWKATSLVTLSLDARPSQYFVSVDHDSVAERRPNGPWPDTPCTPEQPPE